MPDATRTEAEKLAAAEETIAELVDSRDRWKKAALASHDLLQATELERDRVREENRALRKQLVALGVTSSEPA